MKVNFTIALVPLIEELTSNGSSEITPLNADNWLNDTIDEMFYECNVTLHSNDNKDIDIIRQQLEDLETMPDNIRSYKVYNQSQELVLVCQEEEHSCSKYIDPRGYFYGPAVDDRREQLRRYNDGLSI